MNCNTYCIAESFEFAKLTEYLDQKYKTTSHKEVLRIEKDEETLIFIFRYGVVVFWNTDIDEEKRILSDIEEYTINTSSTWSEDTFEFGVEGKMNIKEDYISLESDDIMEKMAISFALAQAAKLDSFESRLEYLIKKTKPIPKNIQKTGKTQMKAMEISKMRGEIFSEISAINLHFDPLNTPDFFWNYPELDNYYNQTYKYLDVAPRVNLLNRKLQVIHELFDMLSDEQKYRSSAVLEWVVICLFLVEIVFSLIDFIPKYFF